MGQFDVTDGQHLRQPGPADDKYSRGVVLLATGSPTYPGAAVLTALGAARFGVGLVRYLGPDRTSDLVLRALPEAVAGGGRFDAAVIGSGWDSSMAGIADSLARTCASEGLPLVVDAGALRGVREWAALGTPIVATPHPGEAATMLSDLEPTAPVTRAQVESDLKAHAQAIAQATGSTVVLKAATTWVVSAEGDSWYFTAPSSWGATAGAGDVLAGVIGAALASVGPGIEAVHAGVIVHGIAAGIASHTLDPVTLEKTGPGVPIVASDIAAALPTAVGALLGSKDW